jgi:hypothetical protein
MMRRLLRSLTLLLLSALFLARASETSLPTALGFSDPDLYRIVAVRTSQIGELPAWIEVQMGALRPITATATGLQQALVEVYLDDGGPGSHSLLPGSGVLMPEGRGWRDAVRLSADGALWWRSIAPLHEGEGVVLTGPFQVPLSKEGDSLRVHLPHPLAEGTRIVAISGVHHPFSETAWRPFSASQSPWAFSGAPSLAPVVGLYPGGADELRALQTSARLQAKPVLAMSLLGGVSPGMLLILWGLVMFVGASLMRWWGSMRWWGEGHGLERPQPWLIGDEDFDGASERSAETSAPSLASRSEKFS